MKAQLDCSHTETCRVSALETAECECRELRTALAVERSPLDSLPDILPDAMKWYDALLADLGNTTESQIARARRQIRRLLGGEIRLIPQDGYLDAEMAGDFGGLVALAVSSRDHREINLVAGGGFEPPTFGL